MLGTMPPRKRKKKRPKGLPTNVYEARLARGLTQADAADLIGVSVRSWRSWEDGIPPPKPFRLLLEFFVSRKI